jgi:MOSC domain-containing protein YiiM
MGSIQSIVIRPERKGVTQHAENAIIHESGIVGEHELKPDSKRHVTLISADALAEVAATVGFKGDAHAASRRNICVDALPDEDLVGRRISLGSSVILEVVCYCTPCKRMDENFGDGAVEAFEKRAGWGARVIQPGEISIGDEFRLL